MRTTVSFLFLFLAASVMQAQSACNVQPQYGVRSDYDVVYGSDVDFAGRVVDLKMNIHRPVGDQNPQRPVVVMIHGGGFIEGDRSQMDNDVLPVCQYFASLGYTAVTIDYRLGMQKSDLIGDALPCGIANGPVCGFMLDQYEFYRAWYRAVQDARGAIRFIKNNLDSVDVNQVFVGGASAGALTALAVGYLEQDEVNPVAAGPLGAAPVGALLFSGCYPANASLTRPAIGSINGTIAVNGPHDASVAGVISIGGAVLDTTWIDSGGPAIYLQHNTLDGVVPMENDRPYWQLDQCAPPCQQMNNNYPTVWGSLSIARYLARMENPPRFKLELTPCAPDCVGNAACHAIDPALGPCILADIGRFLSDIRCEEYARETVDYCDDNPDDLFLADQSGGWCTADPNIYPGLVYRRAPRYDGQPVDLALDLYVPRWLRAGEQRPLVVFFHGGGYADPNETRGEFTAACQAFSGMGYVCATVDYRLGWPDVQPDLCANDYTELKKAAYRAWQDARSAINWLVDQAGIVHIDTGRIIVGGYSAGAQLSLLTGFVSQAEMDAFDPELSAALGPLPVQKGQIAAVISMAGALPDLNLTMNGPERAPVLFLHGDCDEKASYGFDPPYFCSNYPDRMAGARCLADFCLAAGIPYRLHTYQGFGHLFFLDGGVLDDAALTTRDFLYDQVVCRSGAQSETGYQVSDVPCGLTPGACPAVVDVKTAAEPGVRIYPNPGDGRFWVDAPEPVELTVFDVNGRRVGGQIIDGSGQLDLSAFPDGVYFVVVKYGGGIKTFKVVNL